MRQIASATSPFSVVAFLDCSRPAGRRSPNRECRWRQALIFGGARRSGGSTVAVFASRKGDLGPAGRENLRTLDARSEDASRPHCSHSLVLPQRSPPRLLPAAACGGLRSAPDHRTRRALLHLSYSCAAPVLPAMLVTHDPHRTLVKQGIKVAQT